MTFVVGLNVDRAGLAHAPTVKASGAGAVRVPLIWESGSTRYDPAANCRRFAAEGLDVLGLFLPESLYKDGVRLPLVDAATRMAAAVGDLLTWVEIGNEPDDPGASSSTMTPADFSAWLRTVGGIFRQHNGAILVVSGGLSSGQPAWLRGVDLSPVDLVGVHLYDMRPDGWPDPTYGFGSARALLDGYAAASGGRPLLVTEWGTTDEPIQPDYVRRSLETYAAHPRVGGAFYFCYADWMVAPFGLFRADNAAKPAWDVFRAAATAVATLPIPISHPPGGTMSTLDDAQKAAWQLADPAIPFNEDAQIFKSWRDLKTAGTFIGAPIGPEMHLGDVDGQPRAAQAFTSGALLVWWGGSDVRVA